MTTPHSAPATATRWVVLAGLLSLAAAMGIGRFAFTPLLPLMLREGLLDVPAGGWIAAANYVGYFIGALTAARVPLSARGLALLALAATAALTAAMAWPVGMVGWLILRLLAGVASAWVFVATSVWCLGALAARGAGGLSGWVYAGVGSGIALAGLIGWAGATAGMQAPGLWVTLGGLALLLGGLAAWVIVRLPATTAAPGTSASTAITSADGTTGLIVAYGLMGFGYILPATFLPVLARQVVDDPRWFGLAWPLFGATAAASTLLAGWAMRRFSRLHVWSASQGLMGVGVLLPAAWPGGTSVALSALLVGGTFMVITLAGVQEMRARVPGQAVGMVGRLTASFAFGQIAGPIVSTLLLHWPALATHGLQAALVLAAITLLASAAWLWRAATPSPNPSPSQAETHHA